MMATKFIVTFLLLFGLSISSCKKVEGQGGSSTISGKITALDYNNAGVFQNKTYAAADHDVYILYGDENTTQDDRVRTSFDGSFEFKYLEKGNYTIYVYEKCFGNDCATGSLAILKKATITKSKETVNLGTIEIKD